MISYFSLFLYFTEVIFVLIKIIFILIKIFVYNFNNVLGASMGNILAMHAARYKLCDAIKVNGLFRHPILKIFASLDVSIWTIVLFN